VRVVGETAPLIFDLFENIAIAANNTDIAPNGEMSINSLIGGHIRHLFNGMYNLDGRPWFHKPIGLPKHYESMLNTGAPINIISTRYWTILRTVFPRAKIAISLRDPIDNILSISRYTNVSHMKAAMDLCYMLAILSDADISRVKIVDFRELASANQTAIYELFDFWELELSSSFADALSIHYAKDPGANVSDKMKSNINVSDYNDKRSDLNKTELLPYLALSYMFCDRLGVSFERPTYVRQYKQLSGDPAEKDRLCLSPLPPFLYDEIREENYKLYSKADGLERRILTLLDQINQLKGWIVELESGKNWLESKYNEQRQLQDTLKGLMG